MRFLIMMTLAGFFTRLASEAADYLNRWWFEEQIQRRSSAKCAQELSRHG